MLGDPRLKNGLTYYPGVSTSQGVVCLGNVVRLSLQAEDGQSYTGYGHLKGLWLWRDQPYIRVQHFAPVQPRAPRTAVAYRPTPRRESTWRSYTSRRAWPTTGSTRCSGR